MSFDKKDKYEKIQLIQDFYREKWSNFNIVYCSIGICSFILTFVIKLALMFYIQNYGKYYSEFQIRFNTGVFNVITFTSLVLVSLIVGFNIEILSSCCVILFILYVYVSNYKILIFLKHLTIPNRYLVVYFITLIIPFSNSFVIRENICLRYILIGVILLSCSKLQSVLDYLKLVLVLIFCRLSEIFYICREEIQDTCKRLSFSLPVTKIGDEEAQYVTFYVLLSIVVVNITYFSCVEKHVKRLAIKYLLRFQLLIQIFYWILLLINFKDFYFNLQQLLPRIFYVFTLTELFLLFYKSQNVFDINAFFAILFQLIVLLVGENRCISVCILVFILNILTSIRHKNKEIDITMITMIILQQYFFYATGHEKTITNIRWEVAFHGFDGNSRNLFIAFSSGVFLLISTFSSPILVLTNFFGIIKTFSQMNKKNEIESSNTKKYVSLLKYSFLISLKVKLN